MSINITHVRLSAGGTQHEHITDLKWINSGDNKEGSSTKAVIVDWIDVKKGQAYVESSATKVPVLVVKPSGMTPYLRTQANGVWTDNLLSLPRF
jgi:hypothetical protein